MSLDESGLFRDLSKQEEADFKAWARRTWVPGKAPNPTWHPVVRAQWAALDGLEGNGPRPRFVVDSLISGEGYVVVDRWWIERMIGPYANSKNGRETAESRCAAFNADYGLAKEPVW